jgi:hypothetical protein
LLAQNLCPWGIVETVRGGLAGFRLAIAQRVLLVGALALAAGLAAAGPSHALAPGDLAGTPVPDAGAAVSGVLPAEIGQPVGQAVEAARPAAESLRRAAPAPPSVDRPARRAAEALAETVDGTVAGSGAGGPAVGAPAVGAALDGRGSGDRRSGVPAAVDGAPAAGALDGAPGSAALGGALRLVGDTLPELGPVDTLVEPLAPLLGGLGLGELAAPGTVIGRLLPAGGLFAAPPTGGPLAPAAGDRLAAPPAGTGDRLGARAGGPRRFDAHPARSGALTPFESVSAESPMAEAGGRPGSPSPRKAPAPAAGGAAAPAPAASLFVPFLALLVLAALAAPKLLRRLDAAAAFLRPAPFVCALERPG